MALRFQCDNCGAQTDEQTGRNRWVRVTAPKFGAGPEDVMFCSYGCASTYINKYWLGNTDTNVPGIWESRYRKADSDRQEVIRLLRGWNQWVNECVRNGVVINPQIATDTAKFFGTEKAK